MSDAVVIAVDVVQANEESHCPICYGAFVQPTTLDCQMHKFCFKCAAIAMQRERNCPMCRCEVTFLKDDCKIYSLTVLDPEEVWGGDDDDIIGGDWRLRPRQNDDIVPNVRLMLDPNATRLHRLAAFSWFALVVGFWASVLIVIHEFIDSYCWKTFYGKIFASLLIIILLVFTQLIMLSVRLMRTKNIVKNTGLPVITFVLQSTDLIFYFFGPSSLFLDCCWIPEIVRFSWVSIVLALLMIDNPIA
jgi:hypothetical protein